MNVISAIVSGLIVGVLARFFYPGAVEMGWIMTSLLGIGGAVIASLITSRNAAGFSKSGWIASIVGAMVLIFVGRLLGLSI